MYRVYRWIAPDGRVYVGCTNKDVPIRAGRNGSGYGTSSRFAAAIREFGWDSFRLEILYQTENRIEAMIKEQEYIQIYQATNPVYGFNSRTQRYIISPDYNKRLSSAIKRGTSPESLLKRAASIRRFYQEHPEAREAASQRSKAILRKPEVYEKLIEANRRNLNKPEVRQKLSEANERYWTSEQRQKQSRLIQEKLAPSAVRRKISENTKRGLASPETRAKMSAAQYQKWSDPIYKSKTSAAIKAACNTEQHRKNVSEAQKVAQNRPEVKAKLSATFKGLIFINNGFCSKRVTQEEADKLIATGEWVRGRMCWGPRGPVEKLQNRVWVHLGQESKFVKESEVSEYLEKGWELGRGTLVRRLYGL